MAYLTLKLIDAERHSELTECRVDCPAGANEQQICDKVMERLDRLAWQPVPDLNYWLRSSQNGNNRAIQQLMRGTAAAVVITVALRPCTSCQQHEETIRQLRNALHGNKQIVERVRQVLVEAGRLGHTETAPERFAAAVSSVINELSSNTTVFQEIGTALRKDSTQALEYPSAIRTIIQNLRDKEGEVARLAQKEGELRGVLAKVQGELQLTTTELQNSKEENSRLKKESKNMQLGTTSAPTKPDPPNEGHL